MRQHVVRPSAPNTRFFMLPNNGFSSGSEHAVCGKDAPRTRCKNLTGCVRNGTARYTRRLAPSNTCFCVEAFQHLASISDHFPLWERDAHHRIRFPYTPDVHYAPPHRFHGAEEAAYERVPVEVTNMLRGRSDDGIHARTRFQTYRLTPKGLRYGYHFNVCIRLTATLVSELHTRRIRYYPMKLVSAPEGASTHLFDNVRSVRHCAPFLTPSVSPPLLLK